MYHSVLWKMLYHPRSYAYMEVRNGTAIDILCSHLYYASVILKGAWQLLMENGSRYVLYPILLNVTGIELHKVQYNISNLIPAILYMLESMRFTLTKSYMIDYFYLAWTNFQLVACMGWVVGSAWPWWMPVDLFEKSLFKVLKTK